VPFEEKGYICSIFPFEYKNSTNSLRRVTVPGKKQHVGKTYLKYLNSIFCIPQQPAQKLLIFKEIFDIYSIKPIEFLLDRIYIRNSTQPTIIVPRDAKLNSSTRSQGTWTLVPKLISALIYTHPNL
jgi:hypothetical protein